MRILVVGGAGYIGAHAARDLYDRGHDISVLDDLSTGSRQNLFPDEHFFEGSILDSAFLGWVFDQVRPEGVVHLAALKAAGESMSEPERYSEHNVTGSINLLNTCSSHSVKYFVFSSSAATYGAPQKLPMDETHPTSPENYYGYTKLAVEAMLSWYDRLKNLRFVALRYFNAAGYDARGRVTALEKNPANLLPVVMEVAAGLRPNVDVFGDDYPTADGTGVRDYIHVSDLATAHSLAFEYLAAGASSRILNLGVNRGYSVLEVIRTAEAVTGRAIPFRRVARRPGDPPTVIADASLAHRVLGWRANESNLEHLISTTWETYLRAGVVREQGS